MSRSINFQLWQNGTMVASVAAPTFDRAAREIMHYASVYTSEGPCQVKGSRRNMARLSKDDAILRPPAFTDGRDAG